MDLDRKGFESFVESLGHKAFHGRNIMKWIHKHGVTDFDAMTDVSKNLRLQLAQTAEITIPEIIFEQPALDGTTKWILELQDGQRIAGGTSYRADRGLGATADSP